MKNYFFVLLLSFAFISCEDSSTSSVTEDLDQSFANQEKPEDFIVNEETYNDFHKVDENKIIRKLDILFVPDTSSSIKEERKQIADGFHNFFNSLPTNIDTNIGVILAHGPKSNKTGKLHQHNNEPVVLKTSELSLDKIKEYLALKIHKPREDGSSDGGEMGMYSLQEALNSENIQDLKAQGLLREDAALVIVFAADEQDICAKAPEGITLKEDQQNAERKTFVNTCIEEDMHWKDVIVGGNYTYKITPEGVFNKIKAAHPNGRILISGVIYNENSVIPAGNEDEIGYGYKDLIELSGGVSIDLTNGDYSKGLAAMARLASVKEEDIIKTVTMKTPYTDPASIVVTLDGVVYENWSFDKETQTITFGEDKDPLAVIGVSYKNDTTKPEFQNYSILPELTNIVSNSISFDVSDEYLKEVQLLRGNDVLASSTSGNITFNFDLVEGENNLVLKAEDKAGNISYHFLETVTLDTIPPQIANINPADEQVLRSLSFNLFGSSNEKLSKILIDNEELLLSEDKLSFSKEYTQAAEGLYNFEIKLVDLAGNESIEKIDYEILLKLLRIELVKIIPDSSSGKLVVQGAEGATRDGVEIEVYASAFNQATILGNNVGNFEVPLSYFSNVRITARDPINGLSEQYSLDFQADTTFTGMVKDVDGTPLPGVQVTISSSGQSATTNSEGVFAINDPITGDHQVLIDGMNVPESVTQGQKEYSMIAMNVSLGNLQRNALERVIYLAPKLLDGTETNILENQAATVTSIHAPGVSIEIPANSVTFPNGEAVGSINMMEIPIERTSIESFEFAKPTTVYSLEPSGLQFKEPVKLTLPNPNEFQVGQELVIMSKNSETGFWEVDGAAIVKSPGTIETLDGQGITHFSEVYASPYGLKLSKFGDTDKPSIDNTGGEATTSIELPSYKVMGQDVSIPLIYNSKWAHPNALVSNVFNIPDRVVRRDIQDKSGGGFASVDVRGSVTTYSKPESMLSNFFIDNTKSEDVFFDLTSAPDNAVLSYVQDIPNVDSGIYPTRATYELTYKAFTITSYRIKSRNIFGSVSTKRKRERSEDFFQEIFPPDLESVLFVQNYKNSEFGTGWKLGLTSKIINPENDRIMLEGASGSIDDYVVDNAIDNVFNFENENVKKFISFKNNEVIYETNDKKIMKYTIGDSASVELSTWNPSPVVFAINSQKRKGSWECDRNRYTLNVNQNISHLSTLDDGSNLMFTNSGQVFDINDGIFEKLGGWEKSIPTLAYNTQTSSTSNLALARCRANTGDSCTNRFLDRRKYSLGGNPPTQKCFDITTSQYTQNLPPVLQPFYSSPFIPQVGFLDGDSFANSYFNVVNDLYDDGNFVYISDFGNNRIRLYDKTTGEISTFAGNGQTNDAGDGDFGYNASIYHPKSITKDNIGNIYITTERGLLKKLDVNNRIQTLAGINRELTPSFDNFFDTLSLNNPTGVVFKAQNEKLYIADTDNHRIVELDLLSRTTKQIAGSNLCSTDPSNKIGGKPALSVSICNPRFVNVSNDGTLYYLDETNKLLRKVNTDDSSGPKTYLSQNESNNRLIKLSDGSFELNLRNGARQYFNKDGLHLSSVDRVGNTTRFEYNDGKLVKMIDPKNGENEFIYSGNKLTQIKDATGRITNFTYSNNNLTNVTFSDATSMNYTYDNLGLIQEEFDKKNNKQTYNYNEWNRLVGVTRDDATSISLEEGIDSTIGNNATEEAPKPVDNLSEDGFENILADARGIETIMNKDLDGYVLKITDSKDRISTIERDEDSRPIKITKYNNAYVEFQYNAYGDLIYKFDSEAGTEENYLYNDEGDLLEYTNPLNNKKINTYLSNGLLSTEKDYQGNTITRDYFSDGLIKSITNDLGESSSFEYDAFGNLIKRTSPEGEVTLYKRDGAGNIIEKTNANNIKTAYTYDSFNRLTSVSTGITNDDPIGKLTSYYYDNNGNLIKITDPQNNETQFFYDSLNRLTKKITMLGQVTELAYDGNNNVIWEKDPNGNIKTFEYDSDNQLTKKLLPDNNYLMEYDLDGNMTLISDSDSKIEFTYEKIADEFYVASTTSESDFLSEITLEYNYDKLGNRKAMLTPYGDFTYNYDDNNRLTNLTNHKSETFTFGYDSSNRITQITRPNGVITNHSFDKNSFLTSIIHSKSGSDISTFNYTRDFIGNKTSITTGRGIASYGYDPESQLTSSTNTESGINEAFEYDELGNRLVDHNGNYNYDAKSQRLMSDWKYNYSYDENGNLTQRTLKTDITTFTQYTYSSENQLIKVEDYEQGVSKQTVTYAHDALGRRINKTVTDDLNNSIETNYLYDGQEILAEYDDSSLLAVHTHSTLRTDDTLASDIRSKKLANNIGSYFYLKDSLGSIIDITDSSGNIFQHHVYSSFGEKLKTTDNSGNEIAPVVKTIFGFTNREHDDETGLMHYRARVYMPEIGRFVQEDPHPGLLMNPISFNSKFIYANNNSVNLTDPSGLIAGIGSVFGFGKDINREFNNHINSDYFRIAVTIAVVAVTVPYLVTAMGISSAFLGGIVGGLIGGFIGGETGGFVSSAQGNGYKNGAREGRIIGAIVGSYVGAEAALSYNANAGNVSDSEIIDQVSTQQSQANGLRSYNTSTIDLSSYLKPVFKAVCFIGVAAGTTGGLKLAGSALRASPKGWLTVGVGAAIAAVSIYAYASGACN